MPQIDISQTDPVAIGPGTPLLDAGLFVTQYKSCEQLAVENSAGECADSVDQYTNGERLTDPVVWVQVGYHHVPRDEDEDPMPVHWQGFRITPRDPSATKPERPQS